MLKDVTLGQFFPGDTIVHRLDARTKLILVIVYIVGLFQAVGWVSYGAVTLATAACMWWVRAVATLPAATWTRDA